MPDKVFTTNEAVIMMHKNECISLRSIADFAEEHHYNSEQIISWLRELADENEAQIVVVELRDQL
jgi:hypothetical protein